MDGMNAKINDAKAPELILQPVKTMVAVSGGAGMLTGTYVKANADGDPAFAFVGADVMAMAPTVMFNDGTRVRPVQFERELEYVRLGADMDLAAAWATLREHGAARSDLAHVLRRLRGAPPASVEIGTEARRLLAYAAFLWSRREVEAAVERALRRLSDVRLKDRNGTIIDNAPVNVLFIASTAGGVGSGTIYPFAGLVKQVMDRLGMPVHRSLFSYLAIGPSAFPPTEQRLSNSFETLRDIELAQKKGVVLCHG